MTRIATLVLPIGKRLGDLLWRIAVRGLPEGLPRDERRSLHATNLALVFHILSVAPFAIVLPLWGFREEVWPILPTFLGLLVSHRLLRTGWSVSARYLMVGTLSAGILAGSLLLGPAGGAEFVFLYLVAAPFFYFPVRAVRHVVGCALIPLLTWGAYRVGLGELVAPYPYEAWQLRILSSLFGICTVALVLGPLALLIRHAQAVENALERALRESEAANAAKNQFLAMISHELRTPLNGLVGSLDLVGSEPLSYQQKDHLEIARSTGSVIRAILGDISEFTGLEEGGVLLERRSARLQSELPRLIHPYRMQAEAKGLAVRMAMADDLPRVLADVDRLRQMLLHLVSNAVKFTDQGFIEVALREAGQARDGFVPVLLQVRDTGVGIPAGDLAGLLDGPSRTLFPPGTGSGEIGMGLVLALRIVRTMGGTMEVESKVGLGTVVRVRIDLERAAAFRPVEPVRRPETSRPRILLVEDDPVNRLVVAKLLRREGFEVATAVDGEQGVELWKQQRFPVILMDCQMPILDGFGATRAIRGLEQAGSAPRTRILAYTANAFAEDRRKCRECGMDGFLAKPVSKRELIQAISPEWMPTSFPDDPETSELGRPD